MAQEQIILKTDTELLKASTRFDNEILVVAEDSEAPLWIYSFDAYGSPTCIVSAVSWNSAYEALIDELPTIPESEVYEAYGFETQADFEARFDDDLYEWSELAEGYRYQSNCTGTGIVSIGHHESLSPLTTDYLKQSGIKLSIGVIDNY